MAKSRRIEETPFVLSDKVAESKKNKEVVRILRKTGAWKDIEKVYSTKRLVELVRLN